MRNLIRTLPLLVFLCLAFAAETRADPIVVNGGSASVGGITGGPFNLVGNGFVFNGRMQSGPSACGPACRAGDTVNVRTVNSGFDLFPGTGVVNGVVYDPLHFDGNLIFEASIVMPNETSNLFTLTAPFAFHGFLLGCTHDPIIGCAPGDTVFNSSLIGQGTATLTIQSFEAGAFGRLYQLQGVRYDFAPVATPEPATMVLLGTGLVGIGAAVRRRRRKMNRAKSS